MSTGEYLGRYYHDETSTKLISNPPSSKNQTELICHRCQTKFEHWTQFQLHSSQCFMTNPTSISTISPGPSSLIHSFLNSSSSTSSLTTNHGLDSSFLNSKYRDIFNRFLSNQSHHLLNEKLSSAGGATTHSSSIQNTDENQAVQDQSHNLLQANLVAMVTAIAAAASCNLGSNRSAFNNPMISNNNYSLFGSQNDLSYNNHNSLIRPPNLHTSPMGNLPTSSFDSHHLNKRQSRDSINWMNEFECKRTKLQKPSTTNEDGTTNLNNHTSPSSLFQLNTSGKLN